jgi:hypothetical protein
MPALRAALQPSRRTAQGGGAREKAASTAIRITHLIGLSVTVRTFSITCRATAGVACASKTAQLLSDIGCHEIFLDLPVHTPCTRRLLSH